MDVPLSLRRWFVVHFAADVLFGVPLLLAPSLLLVPLGWQQIDPVAARLVGAALLGIGIESLLGRDADAPTFRAMLNLKLIWSSSASVGLLLSLAQGAPVATWAFLAIFVAFFFLWGYYRLRLGRGSKA